MFKKIPLLILTKAKNYRIRKGAFSFLLLFILTVPTIWSLFVSGFYGASDDMHVAWLYEFNESLALGQILPRYVPDVSYQFGYPLFHFVFPLPFLYGSIFYLLGLSLVNSIKIVLGTSLILSGYFFYLMLLQFTSRWVAFLGAMLYVYAPYRATQVYVRGALGESFAFLFLPLIVLAIVALFKNPRNSRRWIGIGSLALACLVCSHNIVAYMFLPFAFLLGFLFTFYQGKRFRFLRSFLLLTVLGLTTSVFFWLPALIDSNKMKYDTVFLYYDHFPSILQLIKPYFGYGASVPGNHDLMSFYIGMPHILVIVLSFLIFIFRFKSFSIKNRIIGLWLLLVLSISFYLMNHRSMLFWERIPFLPYFQFPWRYLTMVVFVSSFLIIFLPRDKYLLIVLLIFVFLANWHNFRPQEFLGRQDSYFLDRYIPYPKVSDAYKNIQEEYFRLPKESEKRPNQVYPRFFSREVDIISIKEKNKLDAEAIVSSEEGGSVFYNKYNFPGWYGYVNGKPVSLLHGSPYGQIKLEVPPGIHKVEVAYKRTPFLITLEFISLSAFVFSLYITFQKENHKKNA